MSTPEERFEERLQWFKDRIGQIIWRPRTQCACSTCKETYENGLKIHDAFHAQYLMDVEGAYGQETEGKFKYFDTKEERDEFEKSINNG